MTDDQPEPDLHELILPPSSTLPPDLPPFIKTFYKICDSRDHAAYSECFTENGYLVAQANKTQGRENLRKMHEQSWIGISRYLHSSLRVYPFGSASDDAVQEVMISGTVEFWNEFGTHGKKDMAVRARYEKVEDAAASSQSGFGWKISFVQVWI